MCWQDFFFGGNPYYNQNNHYIQYQNHQTSRNEKPVFVMLHRGHNGIVHPTHQHRKQYQQRQNRTK